MHSISRAASSFAAATLLSLFGCAADTATNNNDVTTPGKGSGNGSGSSSGQVAGFRVVDLVSDQQKVAQRVDSDLVNAWGIAASDSGFVIADNGSGKISIYDGAGLPEKLSGMFDLGEGISGVAVNTSSAFQMHDATTCAAASLLVSSETGMIFAINPLVASTKAMTVVDRSSVSAVYKGLAIVAMADGMRLFATDFHNGQIDMFDENFELMTPSKTAFVATGLRDGFAPFNIVMIGDAVFVTYAQQDADKHDDVPGAGFLARFDLAGNMKYLIDAPELNSPWGMAMSPSTFCNASGNSLLVGNFGDGHITAIDPDSSRVIAQLGDTKGNPLVIDGLWGLAFGTGQFNAAASTLYFTAGPDMEAHGLFGELVSVEAP